MKSKFSGSLNIEASEANLGNLEPEMGTKTWGASTAPKVDMGASKTHRMARGRCEVQQRSC